MCAFLGAIAGIIGSVASAAGSMMSAKAQAQQDEYNAKVAKINARSDRQVSYSKIEDIGMKADREGSKGLALAGAGGVDPNFGSAALVIFGENAFAASEDKNRQYVEGESKAIAEENKAKAYEASAANERKAGAISAGASFLSGIGGAAKGFSGGGGGGDSTFMLNG